MTSLKNNLHESPPCSTFIVRASALRVLLSAGLLLTIPTTGETAPGETPPAKPGSHADVVGTPYLRAKAGNLKHTTIAATLDTPIRAETNLLWCATFQVAWNELCTLAGEDVRMEREDPVVALLNQKAVTRKHLDDKTYFATAGLVGDGVLKAIADGLERQFKGAAAPKLTASVADLPPNYTVVYAYLFANLPFEHAFERFDYPLAFGKAKVKAFGIKQYVAHRKMARQRASQLLVYAADEQQGVIIELRTRQPEHRLILARVPPRGTLGATAQMVTAHIQQAPPQALADLGHLAVPMLDFDLTRTYSEVTGRPLKVAKPSLAGMPIIIATQQIRFRLTERGAMLKSEAAMAVGGAGPELVFDHPFLILLQLAGSDQPYFAGWIADPELLVAY